MSHLTATPLFLGYRLQREDHKQSPILFDYYPDDDSSRVADQNGRRRRISHQRPTSLDYFGDHFNGSWFGPFAGVVECGRLFDIWRLPGPKLSSTQSSSFIGIQLYI